MNKSYEKVIEALNNFVENSREHELARHYIKLAGSAIIQTVNHYGELRTKRPASYAKDILDGTMARTFEKAISSDENVLKNIWIILNMPEEIKSMTYVILNKNQKQKLTEEQAEETAIKIIRGIYNKSADKRTVKALTKQRIQEIATDKELDKEALAEAIKLELQSNYLN